METKLNGAPLSGEAPPSQSEKYQKQDSKSESSIPPKKEKESSKDYSNPPIVITAVDLMKSGSFEPEYLMEYYLPRVGTAVLVGKPDIGKTQLGREFCIVIANGQDEFLGIKLLTIHQSAIYVSTEDSPDAIRYQLGKQLKGLATDPKKGLRFIFGESLSPKEIISKLESELKSAPADLVVVDSYGDIFEGTDGNAPLSARNAVKPFAKIASQYKCLILFIHHINKAAYKLAPGQEHIQGGSGLVQKVRAALSLTDGEGDKRYLSLVKGNYSPKSKKENSLILKFSESTLLFSNTGITKSTSEIGSNSSENAKEASYSKLVEIADTIFKSDILSYGKFVQEFEGQFGKSSRTAKRVHKLMVELEIIVKSGKGYKRAKPEEGA